MFKTLEIQYLVAVLGFHVNAGPKSQQKVLEYIPFWNILTNTFENGLHVINADNSKYGRFAFISLIWI